MFKGNMRRRHLSQSYYFIWQRVYLQHNNRGHNQIKNNGTAAQCSAQDGTLLRLLYSKSCYMKVGGILKMLHPTERHSRD
jgi:hypothetical protein